MAEPGGQGGLMSPTFWQINQPYLNRAGDYAAQITPRPPQIFLHAAIPAF